MSNPDHQNNHVKILTDEIEIEPTQDFHHLSDIIVSFVKGSEPKFSVGIFGNWGTGKTTLMKLVEAKLQIRQIDDKILTIWFNAWRYEREEHYATIALMKTIAFGMVDHPRYKSVGTTIRNGLRIFGKDILKQVVTGTLMTEEGWKDLRENLPEKMKLLNEMEQDTIYFDGIKKIEEEIQKIITEDPDSRIVVFIDDLDRCSPKKALEVLESMKVFLDIKGFVFVVGLSDQTIVKLINTEYEKSGIRGEDYIQKIIQLPLRIPPWNKSDIETMIEKQITKKLDSKYSDFMVANKKLIALAIQDNPRELKRFINNVIVSLEFSSALRNTEGGVTDEGLLVVEALKSRWNNFYLDMTFDESFRKEILGALQTSGKNAIATRLTKKDEKDWNDMEKKLSGISTDLWNFLEDAIVNRTILGIKNWDVYRHAIETTTKPYPLLVFSIRNSGMN